MDFGLLEIRGKICWLGWFFSGCLKQVRAPLEEPSSGQCLLFVSSAPELDRPFWGWLEPEPRPYNRPQYFASSMLSSKKSWRKRRDLSFRNGMNVTFPSSLKPSVWLVPLSF